MTEHDGRPPSSGDDGTPPESSRAGDDSEAPGSPPSYLFFAIVSSIALVADVSSKAWAEIVLNKRPGTPTIVLIDQHLNLTLAYNKGGAWGMFQGAPEALRKPFFYIVSLAAIAFIVSLFGRVSPRQRALKWGLPLVFGGALGNLADRVIRGSVVDFIDYRADWLQSMNAGIAKVWSSWGVTDHWPTFNIADVAICIGVGLMAVDMFTSRRVPVGSHPHDGSGDGDASAKPGVSGGSAPAPSEPPSV